MLVGSACGVTGVGGVFFSRASPDAEGGVGAVTLPLPPPARLSVYDDS
jgi:hypothetical protein